MRKGEKESTLTERRRRRKKKDRDSAEGVDAL